MPLEFRVNFLVRLYGMAQFYLVRADGELQLYVSPVNWRPESPVMPISSPASLSKDLYERLGTYRTLGWAEATWPLNEDRIDEKAFMDDLFRAFDDRAQVILHEIDSKKFDLVDRRARVDRPRAAHVLALHRPDAPDVRRGAARRSTATRSSASTGAATSWSARCSSAIEPGTLVIVLSDHGFHSFKYGVNLNTWLVENGFIARQGSALGDKNLNDMFGGGGQFWENVDWTRTRAYSLGLGPDLLQPARPRGPGHRRTRATTTSAWPTNCRRSC